MLYIHVYNKTVNVMQHTSMLYDICYYITSNWTWRLYKQRGFCYVARCLLYNKKLCYIAHPNLPDAWTGIYSSKAVTPGRRSCMIQAGRRRAVKVTATVGHRYAGAGQVLRVTARSLTLRATGCSEGPGHCGVYCPSHGLKLLLEFKSPVQLRWLTIKVVESSRCCEGVS